MIWNWSYPVLCDSRSRLGLLAAREHPERFHIYGRGWPVGIVQGNTRSAPNFVAKRGKIVRQYAFDFCVENMGIPNYVSEKFWSTARQGVMPIYWGAPNFTPPGALNFAAIGYVGMMRATAEIPDWEYRDEVNHLLDWYYALPRDSAEQSWRKAAHTLGRKVAEVANRKDDCPSTKRT